MRWRRHRLTPRDLLNIQVALATVIEQNIALIRGDARQVEASIWAREAAGYIAAYEHVSVPGRGRVDGRDQAGRWAGELMVAITEAVARADHQ